MTDITVLETQRFGELSKYSTALQLLSVPEQVGFQDLYDTYRSTVLLVADVRAGGRNTNGDIERNKKKSGLNIIKLLRTVSGISVICSNTLS